MRERAGVQTIVRQLKKAYVDVPASSVHIKCDSLLNVDVIFFWLSGLENKIVCLYETTLHEALMFKITGKLTLAVMRRFTYRPI